ncbi:MAG TPA: hypothetical protein VH418_17215 [Solirubrobacteraceae bacterium]|jgi:hypothetical protein
MSEHEARVRAFYDHEAEESRTGRRRRQVADWGVGEDVFDRLPSRRFSRAESAHARRAAEAAAPESDADTRSVRSEPEGPARRAADARSDLDGSPRPAADARSDLDAPARRPRPAAAARDIPRGGVADGRRTIVIGEPRDEYAAPRRPPRLAHERIGPRPDRIVAYAVGLGLLLILIAILSAGH